MLQSHCCCCTAAVVANRKKYATVWTDQIKNIHDIGGMLACRATSGTLLGEVYYTSPSKGACNNTNISVSPMYAYVYIIGCARVLPRAGRSGFLSAQKNGTSTVEGPPRLSPNLTFGRAVGLEKRQMKRLLRSGASVHVCVAESLVLVGGSVMETTPPPSTSKHGREAPCSASTNVSAPTSHHRSYHTAVRQGLHTTCVRCG